MKKLDRKDFLKSALVIGGAGFAFTQGIGCGSSDSSPDAGGTGGRGTGGSTTPAGTGGSTPAGTGGSTPRGTGGSTPAGTGGTTPAGTGGGAGGRGGRNGGRGTGGAGTSTGGSGNPPGTGGAGTTPGTGGSSTGANACSTMDPVETIGTNHAPPNDHTFMLPPADVATGTMKTYSIRGNSGHDHMITITPAMFTTLRGGAMIMTVSTTGGGHTHSVSVICG